MIQQLSLAELIRFTSPLCNGDGTNEEEFCRSAWAAIHSREIIINVDTEAECKSRKQKEPPNIHCNTPGKSRGTYIIIYYILYYNLFRRTEIKHLDYKYWFTVKLSTKTRQFISSLPLKPVD